MNEFIWGVAIGFLGHMIWFFMIRPIIREAKKNERTD